MPSVCVSTFFESSTGDQPTEQPSASCSPQSVAPSSTGYHLIPTLVNSEYFLIGNPTEDEKQSMYTISVTLAFAENLLSLFPSRSLWPSANMPFEFQFQMLGQPIHIHWELKNMYNIGERVTVRILCTPTLLLRYLKQSMANLTIYLCYEDIAISETVVPIKESIERAQSEQEILNSLNLKEVKISGIYPMTSLLETSRTDYESYSIAMQPQMGIKILLSK